MLRQTHEKIAHKVLSFSVADFIHFAGNEFRQNAKHTKYSFDCVCFPTVIRRKQVFGGTETA
jgi:hypothetical protein